MRKWMSDRLKRRKKAPQKAAGEAGPAPLQPKYFDAEAAPSSSAPDISPDVTNDAPRDESQPAEAPESAEPASASHDAQPSGDGDARRGKRRRRGRGGRGRGRTASPAASAAPAADAAPAAPPQPATDVAPPSTSSAPRGTVILAIGLPGSGKSSWFKRHNITPLSSDLLRALLFDDPTEQRFQDLIFSNLRSMLKARLIARRPLNYVDATNLTPHERQNWIKLAQGYRYEVQAVFFDVPVEVCLERKRERSVPEDVMRRMAAKLRAPSFGEGFAKITVVKVKKKENQPEGE
jgi:predicted kinase